MSHSIKCSHCLAILKSATPVPPGKTVKCPKCKQSFTTPAAAPAQGGGAFAEDDEIARAIAKLEAEQTSAKKPEPPAKPAPPPAPLPDMQIPEVDDDLVSPEDAAPETEVEVDDEPPARRKNRRDERDEDDVEPRSKKKKSRDDDEDEEPRKKKKKRDDDDVAEDSDDDDRPARKSKKKQKAGSSMTLVLLGGGFVALLMCCLCGGGGGGYWFFFSNPVAGRWESEFFGAVKMEWEFDRFGTGRVKSRTELFGQKEEGTVHFTYKYTSGNPGTLEVHPTRAEGKARVDKSWRASVTFDGDTMTLRDRDQGDFKVGLVLRRVR